MPPNIPGRGLNNQCVPLLRVLPGTDAIYPRGQMGSGETDLSTPPRHQRRHLCFSLVTARPCPQPNVATRPCGLLQHPRVKYECA